MSRRATLPVGGRVVGMDLSADRTLRPGLAALAVAATLPYLTLKLLWLCGSTVGMVDPATAEDPALWLLNLVTFGMDGVAALLALAFARPWGQRLPAGLVVLPMWVATGLLGPLLLALALTAAATLLLGGEAAPAADGFLRPWVYLLVYGGFAVQGAALAGAFGLYARGRWGGLLRARVRDLPDTATLPLQRVLVGAAAVLALPVTAAHLYWCLGGTTGLSADTVDGRGHGFTSLQGVWALAAPVAVAALAVVVFRAGPGLGLRGPLAAVWTAGGSVFGWGCWVLLAGGLRTTAPDPAKAVPPATHLLGAAEADAGLLILVVGAIALIEHASARADVESAR
ncbi:hypothetical protein [Kitasatospora camelliae]|uniref:Uncharacterized protein n=1 Tax=Kitasatospora camelliae TaxID=3156397 RepID=A0AAU8JT39_9ACTN